MSLRSMPMVDTIQRYRITVEQYYRMAEYGILPDDARVELLDGEIVEMSAIGTRHAESVNRLVDVLGDLRGRATLIVQNPVRLGEWSEPQPDFMLARRKERGYSEAHPTPEDVFLLVESSMDSLSKDRGMKSRLYARHGIREYWLLDLVGDSVEVRRGPEGDAWRDVHIAHRGEEISPLAFPDFRVPVSAILPPAL